mmetsp:Transcript_8857/g.26188  ORF Transcript_8857/g.26188 Transcript_8857/m.26188 type:complete len:219 (-) Transcript_8857:3-659(-)
MPFSPKPSLRTCSSSPSTTAGSHMACVMLSVSSPALANAGRRETSTLWRLPLPGASTTADTTATTNWPGLYSLVSFGSSPSAADASKACAAGQWPTRLKGRLRVSSSSETSRTAATSRVPSARSLWRRRGALLGACGRASTPSSPASASSSACSAFFLRSFLRPSSPLPLLAAGAPPPAGSSGAAAAAPGRPRGKASSSSSAVRFTMPPSRPGVRRQH